MDYIVFDLEWNQSSKGKYYSLEDMPFEIIQIGAVKMDDTFTIKDEFERVIKPQVYIKLQSRIKQMLGITEADLECGEEFSKVAKDFLSWCGDDYIFCSWGIADTTELLRNMKHFDVESEYSKPFLFYDLQKLFSLQFSDGKTRASLKNAVEELHIEEDEKYHSAITDARYTASVMRKLDMKKYGIYKSVDTYYIPSKRKEELYLNFGDYEKYISKGFNSREAAAGDRVLRSAKCFKCGRTMNREIKWFSASSKNYYALFNCEEHGFIKGKFKNKKAANGLYYSIRIMKLTDESGVEEIKARLLHERELRKERRASRRERLKDIRSGDCAQ